MVHKSNEFYKKLYLVGKKINKRDKFGIWLKIENLSVEILTHTITAALEARASKLPILKIVTVKIEVSKRLIRTCYELSIINQKLYLDLEKDLQELSKMTNGWIKYLK